MGCGASSDKPEKPAPAADAKKKRQTRAKERGDLGSDASGPNSGSPAPHPFIVDEVVSKDPHHHDRRMSNSVLSDISETDLGATDKNVAASSAPVGLQGKGLDQQRTEAEVDLEQEFFVWDDANLDLREMRKKQAQNARKSMAAARDKSVLSRRAIDGTAPKGAAFVFNDFTIDDSATMEALSESMRGYHKNPNMHNKPGTAGGISMEASKHSIIPKAPVAPRNPGDIRDFSFCTRIGHSNRVKCLAIAPGEREYVSCSNDDSIVTYYDTRNSHELGIYSGHQDTVIHAVFSPCGKFLATTSRDNTLVLWDVVTQKAVLTFEHGKVVICCAFSKSSRFIATGCQDKVCRLWECRRGRELVAFAQHEGIIISLSISPDESYVCSASADKTLRIWTANKGKPKAVLKGHSHIILACNYNHDGTKIVSNDERAVKVWSAPAGVCLRTINVEDMNKKKSVAAPSAAAAASKKMSWTLSCSAPKIFPRHFIVASNNRMVFVIDMETGEEALSVDTKAPVYCLAPGHRRLVAFGDSFGNVYFLKLEPFDADDTQDDRPGGADWA